ncbi:MAG: hypothetical protein E7174_04050 [Firmicutes bacterium]|nr:hypothetical protein [Bacillota bacterium]
MKEISDLLKKRDIRALGYKKNGNVIIANTNIGKVVIKKNKNKDYIYNYLNTRNFNYYPEIIEEQDYVVYKYVEDVDIPKEQKILDLVDLVSLMHSKTTHYKSLSEDEYKKIYEDLHNNFEYLSEYYKDIISIIDDKVFMSPSEYLLARNISAIFKSIEIGKSYVENWLKEVDGMTKMRMSVVHNNLDLSHYIRNSYDYLVSWDKSKIDIPVFDLYNLYNNHFLDFDFFEILKRYEQTYPLKKYELELFFILITMPSKIEFNDTEFNMCIKISNEIDKLYKSNILIEEYKKLSNT